MKKQILVATMVAMLCSVSYAQQNLTREQILAMNTEQLSELSLEELMHAVETLGVSSVDELFALIMNKNVSSASKQEEDSFRSPLSSTVITRGEMRSYGVSTIEEALRLVPGMIVSEKTNGVYDVQMRGLNNIPDNNLLLYTENANILVMVDGRVTHSYATGSPNFEALPISIEDIERIEVVRGATSALYGPNAVNGVVNIITTKPDQSQSALSGNIQFGNHTAVGELAYRQSINDKLALGVTANKQERNRTTSDIPFIPAEGYYLVNDESLLEAGATISDATLATYLSNGKLTDISASAMLSASDIERVRSTVSSSGYTSFYLCNSDGEDVQVQYENAKLARRSGGVNGYVSFIPSADVRLDLTGGYQYSLVKNTPVGAAYMAFQDRKSQTGYVNLDASIKDLHLLLNYADGAQDFSVGQPGFQMDHTLSLSGQAEYDLQIKDLSIKPGIAYQYVKYKDKEQGYYNGKEISGFFGYYSQGSNYAELTNLSPSLRLDYRHDGLRLIGAFRADKTNLPDKWNPSWQLAASYLVNEKNFLRFVYGRSFRSATFTNTSCNYIWSRSNASDPHKVQFLGNEDSPLVHIDNFELGYRSKFSPRVLLDAEAFYSISQDYGELKSHSSMLTMEGSVMTSAISSLMSGTASATELIMLILNSLDTKSYIQYDALDFKVHQMGISLNLDWIISQKLIAKVNANVQRTTIDNYYQYSQNEMIASQLAQSYKTTVSDGTLISLVTELLTNMSVAMAQGASASEYLSECMGYTPVHSISPMYNKMSDDEKEAYLASLMAASQGGPAVEGVDRPLGMYYALKYTIEYDKTTDEYYLGTAVAEDYETVDNHKHKATPSVYGMAGLIFKPTQKISASAFANYIGKREYTTTFGTAKLSPCTSLNLKVSYLPKENCEIFFNAHNLLNSRKQEFIYTDKIGGVYTLGVNFSF